MAFVVGSARLAFRGGRLYHAWLAVLGLLLVWGATAWWQQITEGLIVTNMRDQVSWAFYIGNFTFLVGVAAAAVMLVIPAYIYNWKPIKEIAIFGELQAVSAIVMCMLFVLVDVGRPDRVWHLMPIVGSLNLPSFLLGWDVMVLNLYLLLNLVIVTHLLYTAYHRRPYRRNFVVPLLLFSIPAAVGIHTVTAFVYAGAAARPFWNSAILASRFLASAFCSGPAILLILFQILRRTTSIEIKDEAIWKIAELMAYAMFLNLFLFPATRRNFVTLNIVCLLIYTGVYIEKGMALVIPGMTPDTLGEFYEYVPTLVEVRIGAGIFATGFLIFTLLRKIAIPILQESNEPVDTELPQVEAALP